MSGWNLLSFAGDLLAGRSRRREAARDRAQAQAQFDQQMDHSVYRRVKDAERAGIHPLFALGASVGASPTLRAGGSPTGSGIGDAISKFGRSMAAKEMQKAEIRKANAAASRDEAEAQLANSRTAQLTQGLSSRGRDGVQTYGEGDPAAPAGPGVRLGPAEFVRPQVDYSQATGVRAGNIPATVRATLPTGTTVDLPNPELALDDMTNPGTLIYYSQVARDALSQKMTDLAEAAKVQFLGVSPHEVKVLERQLELTKKNPEAVRRYERNFRAFAEKIQRYMQSLRRPKQ